MRKLAARAAIEPFLAMDVFARAKAREAAGQRIFHLEVGQPSTGAPSRVVAAARATLAADTLGYTEALGRPELRRRIALHYAERYGVAVEPAQIVVTTGSSGAFLLAFLACFEPGDRIAVAVPTYPAYRNLLQMLGLETIEIQTVAASRWQTTIQQLDEIERPIDGLLLASPANPTGTILERTELATIARWARAHSVQLIADEIYHGIEYGQMAPTALEVEPDAIVCNGFSKYYCMTGWRLGWMVVPPALERPIERLAQNLHIAAPTLAQHGAEIAFDCADELDRNVARYRTNRDLLLAALQRAGCSEPVVPDGGFYLYADLTEFTDDSASWCASLLDATGVALTPGRDFDRTRGHRTVRLAFPGATEDIAEAALRIEAFLAR